MNKPKKMSQTYQIVAIELDQTEPWRDVLIAELSAIAYEAFEETENGCKAFILQSDFQEAALKEVVSKYEALVNIQYRLEIQEEQNWNEVWESNFQKVEIDNRLLIHAPFHEVDKEYQYQILMEPKMAFGTGHHETTSLVAACMLDMELKDKEVLDFGCGTGILAILAKMMGAKEVLAVDNDRWAYENTIENAEANQVDIKAALGDEQSLPTPVLYDIILANINRNFLTANLSKLADSLKANAYLLISGFLSSDIAAMSQLSLDLGLSIEGEYTKNKWVVLILRK